MPLRCLVLADSVLSAKGVYGLFDSFKVTITNLDDYDCDISDPLVLQNIDLVVMSFCNHTKIIHLIEQIKQRYRDIKILALPNTIVGGNSIDMVQFNADYLLLDKDINTASIGKIIDYIYNEKYIEIIRIPCSLLSPNLSKREIDVIDSLQRGFSTEEICTKLYFSRDTLQKHIKNCACKLGTGNTRHAVAIMSLRLLGDFSDKSY